MKGCRILKSSILRSIYGQVRAGDVSAAPHQQRAFTLVAGAQFARQAKKILAAIEVTSRYQNKARIFAREFVEICQEVRLRGRALSACQTSNARIAMPTTASPLVRRNIVLIPNPLTIVISRTATRMCRIPT